jgi:hypothetical protein
MDESIARRRPPAPVPDGPYRLVHGDVWRDGGPALPGRPAPASHVARGSERLALAFDAEEGTLRRHGEAEAVRRWAAAERGRMEASGWTEAAEALQVVDLPVAQPVLDALNGCVALGSAHGFLDRLAELGEADPSLADIPTYPSP